MVTYINMSELPPVQMFAGSLSNQCQTQSLLRRVKNKICHGHPRVWGLNGGWSNIKINHQQVA